MRKTFLIRIILIAFFHLAHVSVWAQAGVSTLAGVGLSSGYQDGAMAIARFTLPKGIARDCKNDLYIAEWNGTGKIRKIDNATGMVSTIVQAGFTNPNDIAYEPGTQTLVFPEFGGSSRIMRTTIPGVLTVVAGSTPGYQDGAAATAKFNTPAGIAISATGDIYIADYGNNAIRKISRGIVSTIAGNGTAGCANAAGLDARFNHPTGLAFDRQGNLYVTDFGNQLIRKIDVIGNVTTVSGICGTMGSNDGAYASATFHGPHGIYVDFSGNVFVSETGSPRIRKLDKTGYVTTIAGDGVRGYSDANGTSARFDDPFRVTGTLAGVLYVPDANNSVIRQINDQNLTPSITGLAPFYCITDLAITLVTAVPAGGILYGPGISFNMFAPFDAGPGLHVISYQLTDQFRCTLTVKDTTFVRDTVRVDIGKDIKSCAQEVTLQSYGTYMNPVYSWSAGGSSANTSSIKVAHSGRYYLQVADSGCWGIGYVDVDMDGKLDVNLGNDTSICKPDTLILSSVQQPGTQYLWSTGLTSEELPVTDSGLYWLSARLNGCKGSDTIHIRTNTPPIVDLGKDTTICATDVLMLGSAHPSGTKYLWSNGASSPQIAVNSTGTYWLQAMLPNGCSGRDTIHIQAISLHVNLGNDTVICYPDALLLQSAQSPGTQYQWNNGLTSPQIQINSSGAYWLHVFLNGCAAGDTIQVQVIQPPGINIGSDTTICDNAPVKIGAELPGATYLWSTGVQAPFVEVATAGQYWLRVRVGNCIAADTMDILVAAAPLIDLGPAQKICPGDTIILDATLDGNNNYLWSTGSTMPAIAATADGVYWVNVISAYHCAGSDTITLIAWNRPEITLGADTVFCEDASLLLQPRHRDADSLYWSDGAADEARIITKAGDYIVYAVNKCGITPDTISVKQLFCDLRMPNAFTPDGDGINDLFKMLGNIGRLESFSLQVYNRWGELLFATDNKYAGWDGKKKGTDCTEGVYVYLLKYAMAGQSVLLKGNITLIR